MYQVYGDMLSGNCYKVKMLMGFLSIEHEWIHVDVLKREPRTDEFRSMNANGKIPVLKTPGDQYLTESNAILNYLAQGTPFLPEQRLARAKVLQWQFFEQYSHEPFIAVARYINQFLGLPAGREAEYRAKQTGGHKALAIMEQHLGQQQFLVGNTATIADISLYAYTHVADEGGFNLEPYTSLTSWIQRLEQLPGYISMDRANA
jgi:glutathione S-transferase